MDFIISKLASRWSSGGPQPASISTSVIGLPFGSYIGLASTSILEILIAGYVVPGRADVGLVGASCPGAGDWKGLPIGSGVAVASGDCLIALTRGGCLCANISACLDQPRQILLTEVQLYSPL